MKKMIMILFMAVITVVSMKAQEKPPHPKKTPEERADNMSKRMARELVLTQEQQTKVKAVILDREIKRQEKINQMKAEMDKIDVEFQAILTPEQFQKFKQKQEELRQRREAMKQKRIENRERSRKEDIGQPAPPIPEPK